jgi:hypothetical protein
MIPSEQAKQLEQYVIRPEDLRPEDLPPVR